MASDSDDADSARGGETMVMLECTIGEGVRGERRSGWDGFSSTQPPVTGAPARLAELRKQWPES